MLCGMVMGARTGAQRLAEALRGRRKLLRLSQEQVAERGGPSAKTLYAIERGGEDALPRPSTRARLESALEWPPGLIERILDGTAAEAELAERVPRVVQLGQAVETSEAMPITPAVDLPHGDAVARLAVELLGALAVQPFRTAAEQALAEHLHRFVGERLGADSRNDG